MQLTAGNYKQRCKKEGKNQLVQAGSPSAIAERLCEASSGVAIGHHNAYKR